MEITIPVKMTVATDIIEEMKRLGHTHTVTHVEGYRKRLAAQLSAAVAKPQLFNLVDEVAHDL